MSLVCCCANPSCMVNGCQQARALRENAAFTNPPLGKTYPAAPLTEEDVRRILREELARGRT